MRKNQLEFGYKDVINKLNLKRYGLHTLFQVQKTY